MLLSHEEQIIIALRQITQAIDGYSRYLLTEFGLTAPQIATLRLIHIDSKASPGTLADRLHLSPQTIAGILNRLEQRGLIQRSKDEHDRRTIRVRITEAGQAAVRAAPPLLRDRFRGELAKLQTWEQTQILATLQRVAGMMHASDIVVEPFLATTAESPAPTRRTTSHSLALFNPYELTQGKPIARSDAAQVRSGATFQSPESFARLSFRGGDIRLVAQA